MKTDIRPRFAQNEAQQFGNHYHCKHHAHITEAGQKERLGRLDGELLGWQAWTHGVSVTPVYPACKRRTRVVSRRPHAAHIANANPTRIGYTAAKQALRLST
jgi:hypothetical protein